MLEFWYMERGLFKPLHFKRALGVNNNVCAMDLTEGTMANWA